MMIWKKVKLEEIAAKTKYPIGDGDHGAIKPAHYLKEGIPYIRVGDIDWFGNISQRDMVYISEEQNNQNPKSHLYPGDIIIAKTGATIGKVAIIPDGIKIANTTSSIGKITLDPTIANNRFILKYLQSKDFQKEMWSVSHKSAQPGFNIINLKKFLVPLPPLSDQIRIADILSQAESLISQRKESIQLLDEFLKATFLEMFGDPVRNEKGWETVYLDKISSFENGDRSSNYPSGDDIIEEGILFINSSNIVDFRFSPSNPNFISEKKYESLRSGRCSKGDIVFTLRGNGLGKCCVFEGIYEKGFVNAQIVIIRPFDNLNNHFLIEQFRNPSLFQNIWKLGSGSAQPQLSVAQLKKLKIIIPPLELQIKFATIVEKVETLKTQYQQSLTELQNIYGVLSQKAFKGELSVAEDFAIAAEDAASYGKKNSDA